MASSKPPSSDSSAGQPGTEPVAPHHQPGQPRRGTLQPPDWTAPSSVSALALERLARHQAISRRGGGRAEAATLRAQLAQARARDDVDAERVLGAQLARLLVARGVELPEATKLARRSLLMGDSPGLREELSAWFAGLGETALAAGTLEPLLEREREPSARSRWWVRIAVLKARAADARGAGQALVHAAEADRSDPLPYELLGALGAWAGETLTPTKAARAFLEAAQRRLAKNDSRGAVENLLQAFETAPGYELAAERLAQHLAHSGRFQAADEVWRACAKASHQPAEVHARRLRDALGAGATAVALGAALDAGADRRLEAEGLLTAATLVIDGAGSSPTPSFDGLLYGSGLVQLLAARLEVLAATLDPQAEAAQRARVLLCLSRLCAGPLGDAERAVTQLSEALLADPSNQDTFAALRDYAITTGDYSHLLETAVRLVRGPIDDRVVSYVEEVAALGEQRLKEPVAVTWLLQRLSEAGKLPPGLEGMRQRLEQAQQPPDVSLDTDWTAFDSPDLKRALSAIAQRPELAITYLAGLAEMRRREPETRHWITESARVMERLERFDELESLWRVSLEAADDSLASRARLAFVRAMLRSHQPARALELLSLAPQEQQAEEAALLSAIASVVGDETQRAHGLSLLCSQVKPNVRAVFYSVASQAAATGGDEPRALRFAELACRADPSAARPLVCYAEVAAGRRDRVATLALERASEVTIPRAKWCRALAEAASAQGKPETALRWLRRWVSLAPLDRDACAALLRGLAQQDNVEQLNKGLSWLVGQPQPVSRFVTELADALRHLAELAPQVAQQQAGRLLGVLGVRDRVLTTALTDLAELTQQPRLLIAVYERQLSGASKAEAAAMLMRVAELRADMNDAGGAADALRRALNHGANSVRVLHHLNSLAEPATSDGELAVLECRARCLKARSEQASPEAAGPDSSTEPSELRSEAAHAYREWGAALWDLAGDRISAVHAWQQAAELDPAQGDERLARDLIAFAGYSEAVQSLRQLSQERSPQTGARLLLVAAAVALRDGFMSEAMGLARQALELDPSRMEALAVLERATSDDQLDLLSEAYALAETSVLGSYGERALNYRAARQFERRGQHDRALVHAVKAFEAVPAEGVSFTLMLRLASIKGDDRAAALAIERVAARAGDAKERMQWLDRAAGAVGSGPEGKRLRIDVLLRALSVQVEVETLQVLETALRELFESEPEAREQLSPRFDEAGRALLRSLDRASDAAGAAAVSRIAADVFSNPGLCSAGLVRASQLDPQSGAFQQCQRYSKLIAELPDCVTQLLDAVVSACDGPTPPHPDLLVLGERLGEASSSSHLPRIAVARAQQDPANLKLLDRAQRLCEGNPELLEVLENLIPWDEHLKHVFQRVEELSQEDPQRAAEMLKLLLNEPRLEGAEYVKAFSLLKRLYRERGQTEALEELLTRALESSRLSAQERTGAARDLAQTLAERNASAAALDVLLMAERWDGLSLEDYRWAADIAAQSGDAGRELSVLMKLEMLSKEPDKPRVWRRTAALHEQLGQLRQAVDCYERVLEVEPDDQQALEFIRRDAEQREDWRKLADILESELRAKPDETESYMRLAEIFHKRMANPLEARRVLEQGVSRLGDSPELLEALAAALVDASEMGRAADIYRRASRATREPRHAARYAELASRAYLDAGDVKSAQQLLTLKGVYPNTEQLAILRVELSRRLDDSAELGNSLEELAYVSMSGAAERAEMLREAAELALRAEDFKLALARAQRASRIAPNEPAVRLFACALEYRQRGAGTPDEALSTISEMRAIRTLDQPELAELRAFLLAEALDCRVGAGAGMNELREAESRHGPRPLIALGIADRLSSGGRSEEALDYYDRALAGDLRGLRNPADVALFSARYAQQTGDYDKALHFAQEAAKHSAGGVSDISDLLSELRTQVVAHQRTENVPIFQPPPGPGMKPSPVTAGPARSSPKGPPPKPTAAEAAHQARKPSETQPIPLQAAAQTEPLPLVRSSRPPAAKSETDASIPPAPSAADPATRDVEAKPPAARGAGHRLARTQPAVTGETAPEPKPDVSLKPDPRSLAKTWAGSEQRPLSSAMAPGEHRAVPKPEDVMGKPLTARVRREPAWQRTQPSVQSLAHRLRSAKEQPAPASSPTSKAGSPPPKPAQVQREASVVTQGRVAQEPKPQASPPSAQQVPTSSQQTKQTPADGLAAVDQRQYRSTRISHSSEPAPQSTLQGTMSRTFRAQSESEGELLEKLRSGSVEAGLRLVDVLRGQQQRVHELVGVLRTLVALCPGEQRMLQMLLEAVVEDRDSVYASALRHARLAFESPGEAPLPPGLAEQQVQTDALLTLLAPESVPSLEALSIVWLEARHLFKPRTSELPTFKPVEAGSMTSLGALTAVASRLLGATRTVVRRRVGSPSVSFRVRLQSSVELLIDGDGRPESPEFRYHFGAMLLATRPEYVLMYGLSELELRTVLDAILAAFGPPRRLQGDVARIAQLAESLWESLSPRAQRRMQELCSDPEMVTYGHALSGVNRAMRRAGLFVAGDLGVAVRQVCVEDGQDPALLQQPEGLRKLCDSNEHVADLVRFATSLEYAEARWRHPRSQSSAMNHLPH